MPWGRIDDGFWHNHKVLELDDPLRKGCIALYWLALCWCNDELTDGRVPPGAVRTLGGDKAEADELVRVGLWEREGKGYRVHDFLVYNQSRERVLSIREERSRAGRAGAAALWHGKRDGNSHSNSHNETMPPSPVSRTPVSSTPVPAPQRAREPDDAVEAYFAVTGHTPTAGSLGWLNELATDHGEAALCVALRSTEYDPPKTYISRVANALTTLTVGKPNGKAIPTTEAEFMAAQAEKRKPGLLLDDIAEAVAAARRTDA
jgi:hypothetical protein